MKNKYILLILIFFLLAEFSQAQKRDVTFFMTTKYVGPEENLKSIYVFTEMFYTIFSKKLRTTFPCATDMDEGSIRGMLGNERNRQMLGGSGNDLENISEALNVDYLVAIELGTMIGNKFVISVVCMPYRTKDKFPVARASAYCPFSETATDEMQKKVEEAASSMIEKLKKLEICPFKGPITITNNSTLDTIKEYQYDVYCNGMDQKVRRKTEIHNHTYSKWELSRKGNERANGVMEFTTSEKSTVFDEDGCYKCSSGQQGRRTINEEHSLEHSGGGISHESQWNGMPQEDTRVELEFLDNGTYLVIAKGTSEPAKGNESMITHEEGVCGNNDENLNIPRAVRIPLMAIFGPYPGKPTDKVLQKKDTIKTRDPVTKEMHTYTIDFNLKHD